MADTEMGGDPSGSENFYGLTQMLASGAANRLHQAWQRPVRHNLRIERAALWYTLMADRNHEEIRADIEQRSMTTSRAGDITSNYELLAGILTVRYILPFSLPDLGRLLVPYKDAVDDFEFRTAMVCERAPEQVARWHDWLWTARQQQPASPSMPASVLAEGCERVAASIAGAFSI